MTTEEMVLAAVPGPRPTWGRETGAMSTLVATAQGDLALRAAARVLEEHAARAGVVVLEVARVRTADGLHEGVYARCGTAEERDTAPAPPVGDVQDLTAAVDKMTSDLTDAMTGRKA